MYVNGADAANSGASSSSAKSSGADVSNTFMTLLATQLKAQDPTSPMDAKEMVGQLVQFNTLGQIMQVRELLEQITEHGVPTAVAEPAGEQ